MGNIHTYEELKQLQAMPLSIKIKMTETRIRAWVNEYGQEGVYVSFSGGKDSTVLLDIVRNRMNLKDVPAVFVNTGLEYPEIVRFVQTFDNVVILKPKMNFKQVVQKHGYPFFSKEVSDIVYNARHYLKRIAKDGETDLLALAKSKDKFDMPYRIAILLGEFEMNWNKKKNGLLPKDGVKSKCRFQQERYQFMLNAPFDISNRCCDIMKKQPVHDFQKNTGRNPITAQMACESKLRAQKWMQNGCNGFHLKLPISNPMSFWTEQDVLRYIKENNIAIASVYGDIVPDMPEECEGQISIEDLGLLPDNRRLKTTGMKRTGCMFCGFGCHNSDDYRFLLMKQTHPQLYNYIMKPKEEGGLGYKAVIDWINKNGGLNIRY